MGVDISKSMLGECTCIQYSMYNNGVLANIGLQCLMYPLPTSISPMHSSMILDISHTVKLLLRSVKWKVISFSGTSVMVLAFVLGRLME